MKAEGFTFEVYTYSDIKRKKIALPGEMLLWGNFDNFQLLNYDSREIKVAVLKYFGEIVAGISFYEKTYFGFLKIASSPHTNQEVQYGHLYIKNQDSQRAREQVLSEFAAMLKKIIQIRHYLYFQISLPPSLLDTRSFKKDWIIKPNYTYILDMEKIRKTGLPIYVGKKVRNIIKMARKKIKIKPISAKEFYKCYSETYKRQGKTPPLSKILFEKLHQLENATFLGSFIDRKLAGGMTFVDYMDTSYYITSGTIEKFNKSNSSEFLLYSQLEGLINNRQIKYVDLFGANVEKVAYFKAAFEPTVRLYFSLNYAKYAWLFNILNSLRNLIIKFH